MNFKCVWLNIETGEFSNSWPCDEKGNHPEVAHITKESLINEALECGSKWKLIQYVCHTDKDFEFYSMMRLK